MRILVLANNDIGLYKFRKELLEQLVHKNEVFITLPDGEFISSLEKLGCKFIPCEFSRRGMNPFADLSLMRRYVRILKEIRPDVVLTYTIKPNIYGGLACIKLKIPYLSNVTGLGTAIENGGILGFISTTLYRMGLKKARCVFFQNTENERLFKEKKVVRGKTILIPGSGVNTEDYRYEKYPDDKDGIRFLFVGRIMKDKGITELLSAFRSVYENNRKITLDIVGGCDENYHDLLSDSEKEEAVRYHGIKADIHSYYRKCHCVILPSYHEGMANVLLEASSTGRPVITTNVSGCREAFEEGVTGFGCSAGSAESLSNAIIKFLNLSNIQREEMGKKAREKMIREFSRQIVLDIYLKELSEIAIN